MLVKSPGFTIVAVVALALGIGANTAIFSVINSVLLRPLPFTNPDELVRVYATDARKGRNDHPTSFLNLADWREQNQSFERMAAFDEVSATDPLNFNSKANGVSTKLDARRRFYSSSARTL